MNDLDEEFVEDDISEDFYELAKTYLSLFLEIN